jgi:hypothetical protein
MQSAAGATAARVATTARVATAAAAGTVDKAMPVQSELDLSPWPMSTWWTVPAAHCLQIPCYLVVEKAQIFKGHFSSSLITSI